MDVIKFSILEKLLLAKKRLKLGIHLPNAVYNNQSCHILTVLFDRIDQLRVPEYNIYSNTLIYTNVLIYTLLRGCGSPSTHTSGRGGGLDIVASSTFSTCDVDKM